MARDCAANLESLLSGQSPRWFPFTLDVGAINGLGPAMELFRRETGHQDPAEFFDYDFRCFSLTARFGGDDPRSLHRHVEPGTTFDEWGCGHLAAGAEGTPDRTFPPLADAGSAGDVEAIPTPRVNPADNLEAIREYHSRGYPVFGYAGSVYEWSWWLRGMDRFMMDLLLEPAIAEAIVRKVAAYTKELALASIEAGIDVLCFYDDAGMQTGMQISPEHWRRFIKPAWKDVLDSVRRRKPAIRTFLHSCGNIRQIVPDIVDLGFEILHPIQPECMDLAEIKAEFGRHIVPCATVSAQRTMAFGTPRDIRREVRRLKQVCSDRRAILCPSNMFQPETLWENILAFVEEARSDE